MYLKKQVNLPETTFKFVNSVKYGSMTSSNSHRAAANSLSNFTTTVCIRLLCVYGTTSGDFSDRTSICDISRLRITSATSSTDLPGVADRASTRKLAFVLPTKRITSAYEYFPRALWASSTTISFISFAGKSGSWRSIASTCGVQ